MGKKKKSPHNSKQTNSKTMNLKKTISLSIFLFLTFSTVYSQNKKFDFFGSFNYGLGNLTAKVSSSIGYPFVDEVKKLKSGTTNQFEFGAFYHKFGLGFIHNSYVTNASTNYKNADVDGNGYFENGILKNQCNSLNAKNEQEIYDEKVIHYSVGARFVAADCCLRLQFAVHKEHVLQPWRRNDSFDGKRNGAADHRMHGLPI